MSCQAIHRRLDSILQFLAPHWPLINCHMVNYLYDNHWHSFVPSELANEIVEDILIDECIETVFWNLSDNLTEPKKFPEFLKFRLQAQKHSLHAFSDVITTPEEFKSKLVGVQSQSRQQFKIKEFLSEKKRHEVEITAGLVNVLITSSPWKDHSIIIDAGDGKGYLSSRIALEYGHKVLGIDSNISNTKRAIERSKKLKKAWNGLKERAELESQGVIPARRGNLKLKHQQKLFKEPNLIHGSENYKTIDKFITSDLELCGLLEQHYPKNDSLAPPAICLTGLHTCGNLAATCLKLFHSQKSCKLICNIGCCYHLLKEQFSEPEFFGNKQILDLNQEVGFPLSKYLQKKKIKLGRNARMLAAQSIERTVATKELPNTSLFYRALLELLICEQHPEFKDTVQVGRIRKFNNFKEYVDLCQRKFPHLNLNEKRVAEIEKLQNQNKKYLNLFYLLRMTFASVLEALILLDRLLYLKELGHEKSFLLPVFDPVVSPRHYAIVAIKNEQ